MTEIRSKIRKSLVPFYYLGRAITWIRWCNIRSRMGMVLFPFPVSTFKNHCEYHR